MSIKRMAEIVFASALAFSSSSESDAGEYAFTAYPLGSLSFGAGITPPPGTYVTEGIAFYTGKISGPIEFDGRNFNAGAKVDLFFDTLNIAYVPNEKVFGGYLGVSFSAPVGYISIDAGATGPRGNSVTSHTEGGGAGDISFQLQLGWDGQAFSHNFHILFVAPTGRWERGFNPILGLNRPSLDLGWAFTYYDKTTHLQFNGALGYMTSIENYVTQYQTGDEFHFEWAIGYKFNNGLEVGIIGYDYRQVTGDSGQGAVLGPFEGTVDAIGVGLTYSTKIEKVPVTLSVRDYQEYNTEHRWKGNLSIATFTAAF